ncbi:hypothetical protein ACGIF2_09015 [Cellulomonas sp. P22]|uniref:hypothetical protein n=1 Tax=Cellulomonas sp. P22 TaxID=3373189 RepID=UPI0037B39944
MTSRTRRGTRAGVVALVGALALGACSSSLPQAEPEAPPAVAPPVLNAAQSENILTQLGQVLGAADAALDPALLTSRVSGPALAIRTAEYVRATATAGAKVPTALPVTAQSSVVADTTTWPRTQLVITDQPDDLQAQRVLVLRQDSAREPYRLWGWARLGGGVQMPATADTEIGSQPIAPDDGALLLPPADVVTQYADVLTNGDASASAATFAPDFFRATIEGKRAESVASVQVVGTATETYTPVGEPISLSTADGGAVVVAELSTVTTLAISQGSLTLADPFEAALAGRSSVGKNLTRTWTDVLVFYVPPAGSPTTQVQVLAAEHALTAVTGE